MDSSDFIASHCCGHSDFTTALTRYQHIIGPMLEYAKAQPNEVYVTAVSDDGVETVLTYGELEALSRRQAVWLRQKLNIHDGDLIAFLPFNDVPSVLAIFSLLRAGASIFFINPSEPRKRMDDLLSAMPVKHVLGATACAAERPQELQLLPDPAQLPACANTEENHILVHGSSPAMFFGTSGSTAASKIVAQAHYNATVNAEALRRHHRLQPGVTLLGCLPIHHVNGLHFTLLATFWSGSHAVLMESFRPKLYWQCLQKYRPALASVVPSLLEVLLCTPNPPSFPKEFRYFVSAAAPLSNITCRAVFERFGVRVNQGYGLTETTNFSTAIPPDLTDAAYRKLMLDAEIPSIGIALFGNDVAILRADGTRAENLEHGEICMRGHNVMLNYHSNIASTAEAFESGWFHSGDLGYELLDSQTGQRFFVITGRKKNIAKVMGIAVSLEEMERTLRKHPNVIDAACLSKPDQLLGETIVAVVVSATHVGAETLHVHLAEYFPPSVLPNKYQTVDAIPRTSTGKLLRRQLSELVAMSEYDKIAPRPQPADR